MATGQKRKAREARNKQVEVHKALSHELRIEILTYLTESTMASPVEMSRALGVPVGDVSHHVKQLVKYGCAEEVETRPRRGAIEHFYRATSRPFVETDDLEVMAKPHRRAFSSQVIENVLEDLDVAFEAGTIDSRTDWHLTRVPMTLDAKGWEEIRAIYRRALDETSEVQTKSHERRQESGEEPVRYTGAQLLFEMPPK